MSKKKKYLKPEKNSPKDATEPSEVYNSKNESKTIQFFSSFEEMNEFDYRTYASYTPEISLSQVTLLRLTRYPYLNTNLNPWGNNIYID